jgi:diguanylate cyclase (GGDEF)-like protein/PAS domain S-box-containing protein
MERNWSGDMDYKELMAADIPIASAIISYGEDWKIEKVNTEFVKLSGYTERDLGENGRNQLITEKDCYLFEETLAQTIATKMPADQVLRIRRKDQEIRWVAFRSSVFHYIDAVPYLFVVFWDIDQQKRKEIKQEILNKKYEMIERLSHEYPFDLDVKSWTMMRSHRLMELRGVYGAEDVYYPVDEEVLTLSPVDRKIFLDAMHEAAMVEKSDSVDTRFNISKDGEAPCYQWFRTLYKSVTNAEGEIIRIIGRSFNIDMDKSLQEEVRRDPLTQLLNKLEVQKEVTHYIEENPNKSSVLFLIDIDNFKGINDNFGHTFGDTVIMDTAKQIRNQFRMDDIVGRVGGDEFLVFMKNTTVEKAEEKAKFLCHALEKKYTGRKFHYRLSVSIGMAVYAKDGDNYYTLFEKADHAMYRAKQAGKDGYQLAQEEDCGPVESNKRVIDRQEQISQDDRNFLAFTISLMAHARDLDGSLNLLLKRIAERYHLDMVAVMENAEDDSGMMMTNYYSNVFSFYDRSFIQGMHPMLKDLKPGEHLIFDPQIAEIDPPPEDSLKESKAENNNNTAVIIKFEYVGERTGEVVYLSMNPNRQWKSKEIEMMQELSRTIAIFVSLRFQMDESKAQIRKIQKSDHLTNLYNQSAFREKAQEILKNADENKIYALEYLDINNFGYVNENYGYKVGDSILKMFAADLSSQPYYCAGCRLYSDFFLVLLCDENKERLEENLSVRNRRFTNMQNHQYPNSGMGVTAGVYVIEDVRMDIEQAIENANLAWKSAKNAGKQGVMVYVSSLRTKRAEEQKIVGEFFEALYRDDFRMYLQPKFILGERHVYGAEALARWKRPDGTILPPAYFMDSLEKIGYVTELDFYIFEEVLKTLDKWKRQKRRKLVVSTNFSGRHFDTDGEEFLGRIQHIFSKYTVPAEYIEIEVTEGVLVKNVHVLERCMKRLHEIGFRVSIDDFGTGYSSLSVLADMPADVVKIDKSFINKDMNGKKMDLLYEIGRMVKILQKDIIIEGVETEKQEKLLINGGFTCGQGYLCNRPIPIGEFERLYL